MEIKYIGSTNAKFQLEIFRAAYADLDSRWKAKDVGDRFSRLYFVKDGNGYIEYNGKRVELQGGKVYLVPAELTFSYGCQSLEKIYFHISATTIEKYDMLAELGEVHDMDFSASDWDKLYEASFAEDYVGFVKMKSILYNVVEYFAEKISHEDASVKQYSEVVKNAMKYIQDNVRINLTTHEIAEHLYVSESQLRKSFRAELGVTIGKYIDDLVLLTAKRRLANKRDEIHVISDELGFCDRFYFSRRFKEIFGRTPYQYRKEMLIL